MFQLLGQLYILFPREDVNNNVSSFCNITNLQAKLIRAHDDKTK